MNIADYVVVGRRYEFDCEYLTASSRRTELVGGVVSEVVSEGTDTFVILNDRRAINLKVITRVIGPYV